MKKPVPKVRKAILDYHECAKYIEHKLGVYDLRDFAGKYAKNASEDTPYQDFWHYLLKSNDVHNGCTIIMPSSESLGENWQKKIVNAFNEQFGEDEEYWVEW